MGIERVDGIEDVLVSEKYYSKDLDKILDKINDENTILIPRNFNNEEKYVAIMGIYSLLKKYKSNDNSSEAYVFRNDDIGFKFAAEYAGLKENNLVLNYIDALNVNLKKIKDF